MYKLSFLHYINQYVIINSKGEVGVAVVNSKLGRFSLFLANPMVAKINKVEESGEPSCKASGIVRKTIFLLLLTIIGVAIFFLTSSMVPDSYINAEGYNINIPEAIIAVSAIFIGIIGTFISFKFVRSAFFFGSVYSLGQGYAVAFACNIFGLQYVYPCLIALALTILIVLVMLILYRFHLVNVHKKFISVVLTLFFVGLLLTLGVFVMNAIPATQEYAQFIINNSAIVAVAGAVGIIIACLLLLIDFEVIDYSIDNKLPKKYEWLSAFALSFSIIEVYLKILNFLLQATQNKKES